MSWDSAEDECDIIHATVHNTFTLEKQNNRHHSEFRWMDVCLSNISMSTDIEMHCILYSKPLSSKKMDYAFWGFSRCWTEESSKASQPFPSLANTLASIHLTRENSPSQISPSWISLIDKKENGARSKSDSVVKVEQLGCACVCVCEGVCVCVCVWTYQCAYLCSNCLSHTSLSDCSLSPCLSALTQ